MTSQATYIDEWLNKAFRLAYFLHGDRKTAMQIALNAMSKLETASNAQFKRYYYTPTGRADSPRATRNKVSMNDLQLLQRLVFVESEIFEKEKESAQKIGKKSLLTYFIKHLVRISLKRNSFYVTLGMSRILHNYATTDAMEIFNIVMQDPERVHDDYYYRSRKGLLMKELKSRFDNFLEVVRVNRGEERFQSQNSDENLVETARKCLQFFTPWKTDCTLPDKFNPFDDELKSFKFEKKDPDEEHRIEINRIHAALHPNCFNRLTHALRLPPPAEKMEIPEFMFSPNQSDIDENNDDRHDPPNLEADELEQIKDVLSARAESRRTVSTNLLRVVVDGSEQARINLDESDSVKFNLDESAELIEVRVVEKDGDVVLATHLLNFEDLENGRQIQSVLLEGGQKVSFNFVPTKDEYNEIVGLNCNVEYAETAFQKRLALAFRRIKFALLTGNRAFLKPVLAFGLILLALISGLILFRQLIENKPSMVRKDDVNQPNQNKDITVPPGSEDTPKEPNKTNVNSEVPPEKPKDVNKAPIIRKEPDKPEELQKPKLAPKPENTPDLRKEKPNVAPSETIQANNNKPRKEKKETLNSPEIVRLPIRESGTENPNTVRNIQKIKRGKLLAEVKNIYVEVLGDENFSGQINRLLSDEITKNKAFTVLTDKEQADAALKISVQHDPEDKFIRVIVRLVNAEGFVIYPSGKGLIGWKYAGKAEDLPKRIVRDLINAKLKGR